MIERMGPLMRAALRGGVTDELLVTAAPTLGAVEIGGFLPALLQLPAEPAVAGETWVSYRERVGGRLGPTIDRIRSETGAAEMVPLFSAGAIAVALTPEQIAVVAQDDAVVLRTGEVDPPREVVQLADVGPTIGLPSFRAGLDIGGFGANVSVAVLDSGVDAAHPALSPSSQQATCDEPSSVPGRHGTHVAGIVASNDEVYRGVAPGVSLHDIKVLRANGTGTQSWVAQGIDIAIAAEVDVANMSLGWNHLPPSVSPHGHGWVCADGRCPLCVAVDTAVTLGVLVVVAAGNEHQRAETVRDKGFGNRYDTELACPGQSRSAVTVAAHRKGSLAPAVFSSSGPTSYGAMKPDVIAPGVNIVSTVPLPRTPNGAVVDGTPALQRVAAISGTSMAAPVVAGVCALLIEQARSRGRPDDPAAIREELLRHHVSTIGGPADVRGAGRLRLA